MEVNIVVEAVELEMMIFQMYQSVLLKELEELKARSNNSDKNTEKK